MHASLVRMREVVASVREDSDDAEHPDAWLTHGLSGWTLTFSSTGVMTLENADRDDLPSRFMRGVSPIRALELWQLLAGGNVKAVLAQPWERLR
ncbi:MAG: hypothetical protein WC360_04670 [Opitutales bacterium]|jgi:hypothetical protein